MNRSGSGCGTSIGEMILLLVSLRLLNPHHCPIPEDIVVSRTETYLEDDEIYMHIKVNYPFLTLG